MKKYTIPKKKLEELDIEPAKGVKLILKLKNRKDNVEAVIKEVKKHTVVVDVSEDSGKKK